MRWLEQTHGTKFELVRHFLARMFDSEMSAARGQWGAVAVSAFALAVPMGILALDAPRHDLSLPLARALAITGIPALIGWQWLLPSRRDFLALAGQVLEGTGPAGAPDRDWQWRAGSVQNPAGVL